MGPDRCACFFFLHVTRFVFWAGTEKTRRKQWRVLLLRVILFLGSNPSLPWSRRTVLNGHTQLLPSLFLTAALAPVVQAPSQGGIIPTCFELHPSAACAPRRRFPPHILSPDGLVGALFAQALSRGCGGATFIELDPWVVRSCLQPNITACGMDAAATIMNTVWPKTQYLNCIGKHMSSLQNSLCFESPSQFHKTVLARHVSLPSSATGCNVVPHLPSLLPVSCSRAACAGVQRGAAPLNQNPRRESPNPRLPFDVALFQCHRKRNPSWSAQQKRGAQAAMTSYQYVRRTCWCPTRSSLASWSPAAWPSPPPSSW